MKDQKKALPINQIIQGNVIDILRTLPNEFVDMAVTSPPYWGLRAYGTEPQKWDGDPDCAHTWSDETKKWHSDRGNGGRKEIFDDSFQVLGTHHSFCRLCHAWRGELGLEPYFFDYVRHLCQIFDEVRRVLKTQGTLWVNLGDTYASGGGQRKSLCQIPSRFAIEMCTHGWILRNELIWWKPNCMPSSVRDRFTVDFEKIFFFSKNQKYFFEPQFEPYTVPLNRWGGKSKKTSDHLKADSPYEGAHRVRDMRPHPEGRNKRTVWRVPSARFPEAHFATYPPALVETPINAGCPEFVCRRCGKAREKVYEGKSAAAFNIRVRDVQAGRLKYIDRKASRQEVGTYDEAEQAGGGKKFVGYTDCGCRAGFEPGIVLDPFIGSGTTAIVARALHRCFIGIELSPEYIAIAKRRIHTSECIA